MQPWYTAKNKKPGLQKEAGLAFLVQQDTQKKHPTYSVPACSSVSGYARFTSKDVRPFFATSKRKGRSRNVVSVYKLYTSKNIGSQYVN